MATDEAATEIAIINIPSVVFSVIFLDHELPKCQDRKYHHDSIFTPRSVSTGQVSNRRQKWEMGGAVRTNWLISKAHKLNPPILIASTQSGSLKPAVFEHGNDRISCRSGHGDSANTTHFMLLPKIPVQRNQPDSCNTCTLTPIPDPDLYYIDLSWPTSCFLSHIKQVSFCSLILSLACLLDRLIDFAQSFPPASFNLQTSRLKLLPNTFDSTQERQSPIKSF